MAKKTVQEALDALIAERKPEFFTEPVPPEITDAEVLGIAVSQWSEWTIPKIVDVAFNALHDANAHDLADLLDLVSLQDDDFVTALLEELRADPDADDTGEENEYAEHSVEPEADEPEDE